MFYELVPGYIVHLCNYCLCTTCIKYKIFIGSILVFSLFISFLNNSVSVYKLFPIKLTSCYTLVLNSYMLSIFKKTIIIQLNKINNEWVATLCFIMGFILFFYRSTRLFQVEEGTNISITCADGYSIKNDRFAETECRDSLPNHQCTGKFCKRKGEVSDFRMVNNSTISQFFIKKTNSYQLFFT